MTQRRYIVGAAYDWAFFLAPPIACLVLGIIVSQTSLATDEYGLASQSDTLAGFATGAITHAHLVAVLFRSHGNAQIRRRFPLRFFVVPVLLYLAIVAASWIAALATIVATFWDVWHSGAQTFGFARIYERNHGTPPALARRLDFWMNQLLYLGPVLAGATLAEHAQSFDALWKTVPARVDAMHAWITAGVLLVGGAFIAFYVVFHVFMARRGHRPSWQKVWLIASTGAVSIYTWGFNSWGQAFLIMNVFHAVQYLALVWAMEGRNLARLVRLPDRRRVVLVGYLASVFAYGLAVEALDPDVTSLWAVTMVVSLVHFWYDAFIWSVRRAEV